MTARLSLSGVMAWLLRAAAVLALVMLGVTMPQGAARAGPHEMHGMSGAIAEMPISAAHGMADHGPRMDGGKNSGLVHKGHSLACAIACVGVAMPAAGLLAPVTFHLVSTRRVEAAANMPLGRSPAPAAHPPKSI